DRLRDLVGRLAGDVDLRRRQLALVDHHDRAVFPFDGWQHDYRNDNAQRPTSDARPTPKGPDRGRLAAGNAIVAGSWELSLKKTYRSPLRIDVDAVERGRLAQAGHPPDFATELDNETGADAGDETAHRQD